MKKTTVTIPWEQGLHARPATKLVLLARRYRSAIHVRTHDRLADARSIISILLLCATCGTMIEFEARDEDEDLTISAIEQLFEMEDRIEGPALGTRSNDMEERET